MLTTDQRAAVNPKTSVWAEASAGSGKTKVLTDRLLALLCEGADPSKILCVTFTRAAAAEMHARLIQKAKLFAGFSAADLSEAVKALGLGGTALQLSRAGNFFQTLMAPGGNIKIQTLHGFAESLLKRFPVEAGALPHFTVWDEGQMKRAFAAAIESVLSRQLHSPKDALGISTAQDTKALANVCSQGTLMQLLQDILFQRARFPGLFKGGSRGFQAMQKQVAAFLGANDTPQPETLEAFLNARPWSAYQALEKTAQETKSSKSDGLFHLLKMRSCGTSGVLAALKDLWLTKSGTLRRSPFPKTLLSKAFEDEKKADAFVQAEGGALVAFLEARSAQGVVDNSAALHRLAFDVFGAYDAQKKQQGALDYDDLLSLSSHLLQQDTGWVLYKLDGGIDHLLIDEAQDTSGAGWGLIHGLLQMFFDNDKAPKTLFVVGDPKQSIYSFQGAQPALFQATFQLMQNHMKRLSRPFRFVRLDTSFRSAPLVLQAIDRVFQCPKAKQGVLSDTVKHNAGAPQKDWGGSVTVWSLFHEPSADGAKAAGPRAPSGMSQLAMNLAMHIHMMLENKSVVPATGRPLDPSDIMVLVRKRGPLLGMLTRFLKERGIPVSGQDRLLLTESLAVQDCVALARVCLAPFVDMDLATVLKSPLCGLSEEQLFALCHKRPDTLWRRLMETDFTGEKWQDAESFQKAAAFLQEAQNAFQEKTPFDFFCWLLWEKSGAARLVGALGKNAVQPLQAFLAWVQQNQQESSFAMQTLLARFEGEGVSVKRDVSRDGGVRLMTVHGAKGLEAPVVIIPDAASMGRPYEALLWSEAGVPFLPLGQTGTKPGFLRALVTAKSALELEEYNRLLYVALTRASHHLLIAGTTTKDAAPEDSWYAKVIKGLRTFGKGQKSGDCTVQVTHPPLWNPEAGDGLTAFQEGAVAKAADAEDASTQADEQSSSVQKALPAWATQTFKGAVSQPAPLGPASLGPAFVAAEKKATVSEGATFPASFYGDIVHMLLQHLPSIPESEWPPRAQELALAFVDENGAPEGFEKGTDALGHLIQKAIPEAAGLLRRFAFLQSPEVLREVPFVWQQTPDVLEKALLGLRLDVKAVLAEKGWDAADNQVRFSGRADVLCPASTLLDIPGPQVMENPTFVVLDYKTGQPPQGNMPNNYRLQLMLYISAFQDLLKKPVWGGIVWTKPGRIQWLPTPSANQKSAGGLLPGFCA